MNKAILFVYSGVGNGNPLQYSYPENPMDREIERESHEQSLVGYTVHRVAESNSTEVTEHIGLFKAL